ncbi:MAG: polyprenyl synthetase family protein [Pseudomonadales bacterium]
MSLKTHLSVYRQRLESQLEARLSHTCIEPQLQAAMRHSVFNGGKRVRPCLVYLVNQALGGSLEHADAPAAAIECLHSYSLVHDDLPAMDDDDLRRGQPTCHIAFDEATAILAGDALQCIAFEWLSAEDYAFDSQRKLKMISALSTAAGDRGMVAGQAFDLSHVGQPLTLEQLQSMHRAKTGALLSASVELGILSCANDTDHLIVTGLRRYAAAIGLAFQVHDDIIDITSDTQTLGKPQGSDLESDKPTYVSLLGLDGARHKAQLLVDDAVTALEPLGKNAAILAELARYIIERDH